MQVQANFSDFEPGWIDDLVLVNSKLPKQEKELAPEEAQKLEQAQAIADSGSTSIVSVIVFNMLTSGAMSQIWGMINSMQVYSHLPVFPIELATYSKSAVENILEISSFEIIPTSWVMEQVVVAPDGDGEEPLDGAIAIEYESYYMINNMGTMFAIFCWLLVGVPVILLLLRLCQNSSRFARLKGAALRSAARGKVQLRFITEGSLAISLCLAFQFYYSDLNQGLNFSSPFMAVNTLATVFFAAVLALFLPLVTYFYIKNREHWEDEKFDSRYGEILDGLRKDRLSSLGQPLYF